MFWLCLYHVNKVNYADNCNPRISLKPHVYWMFYHFFSICCITISFWKVTKVVVKPSFELKRVRWRRKFARLMRFFEIDVAECNLKPSMKRFKTLGVQKLLLAHTISYIFPWKLLFTIVVSREWHMKENQQGLFHASSVETACILPSLRKSGVNMARFKVSGNQKFA